MVCDVFATAAVIVSYRGAMNSFKGEARPKEASSMRKSSSAEGSRTAGTTKPALSSSARKSTKKSKRKMGLLSGRRVGAQSSSRLVEMSRLSSVHLGEASKGEQAQFAAAC